MKSNLIQNFTKDQLKLVILLYCLANFSKHLGTQNKNVHFQLFN